MQGTQTEASSTFEVPPSTIGLLGIVRILFKWSFIVAPLCALTVWVALSLSDDIQPEYRAEAALLLIGPSEIIIEDSETGEIAVEEVNPLQVISGTLNTVAQVVILSLTDVSVKQQLIDEGLTANIVINAAPRTPIVGVEAIDEDPDKALRTVERLSGMVFDDLKNRQDKLNAPETNRIAVEVIRSGLAEGGPDYSERSRFRLAIAAVGFAISFASAFVLEGIWELVRRRKARKLLAEATLKALPSGDPISAEALEERERETLTNVLHMLIGSKAAAASLATEAVEAASVEWANIVDGDEPPVDWLYGRAVRSAWAHPSVDADPHVGDDELWTLVQDLPQMTRTVLALTHLADFSDRRTAGVLEADLDEVREHRSTASDALRALQKEAATT